MSKCPNNVLLIYADMSFFCRASGFENQLVAIINLNCETSIVYVEL